MSGLVETLGASKVQLMRKKGEEGDRKKIKRDIECKKQTNKGGKSIPRREQLIGRSNTTFLEEIHSSISESEPEVSMESLSIICPGRPEIALSYPFISSHKTRLFTLKEGTKFKLKFSFMVSNNLVSGLKFENTLWKSGIRVDKSIVVLGTFSPQDMPHEIELEEDTVPSGVLIRGSYGARTKVVDDHGKCYMDVRYYFDIKKSWPSNSC